MSFQSVAEVSDVTSDRPFAVEIPATGSMKTELDVVIVLHEGEYFALVDECTHGAVPLSEGDVEDGAIECYLHGSVFDLRTGVPRCLPATEPVKVFPCRVDGTSIEVDIDNPINPQAIRGA